MKLLALALVSLCLTVAEACASATPASTPAPAPTETPVPTLEPPGDLRDIYGGHYIDVGTKLHVIYATRGVDDPTIRAMLIEQYGDNDEGYGSVVREVEYTLRELNVWYKRLRDPVWSYPEIAGSSIAERSNRIRFRIRDIDLVPEVQKTIVAEGVPIEAVIFQETGAYPYVRQDKMYRQTRLAEWWDTLQELGVVDQPGVTDAHWEEGATRIYIGVETRDDVDPLLDFLIQAGMDTNAAHIELGTRSTTK